LFEVGVAAADTRGIVSAATINTTKARLDFFKLLPPKIEIIFY
jgi:hypothetical protein